jgi:hypothetical protein
MAGVSRCAQVSSGEAAFVRQRVEDNAFHLLYARPPTFVGVSWSVSHPAQLFKAGEASRVYSC